MKKVALHELPREGVSHDPDITKQVMLRRGDAPHLTTFARATLSPGQIAHEHAHRDMHEVFFVEAGSGLMRIENVEHALQHGVCITIAPGERHEITNNSSSELVLLYFGVEA